MSEPEEAHEVGKLREGEAKTEGEGGGINHALTPRNGLGRIRENLLDVDSVLQVSAFQTKPAKFSSVLWLGASKILLFPLSWHWWKEKHVSLEVFVFGSALYILQSVVACLVLIGNLSPSCNHEEAAAVIDDELTTEMTFPIVLWLICSIGYGHLVAASQPEHKREWSRKALLEGGVGSHKRKHVSEDEEEVSEDEDDEPYSEELQEREERVLLNRGNGDGRGRREADPEMRVRGGVPRKGGGRGGGGGGGRAPTKDREGGGHETTDDEEGLWGLGGMAGGGAVRVTLFDELGHQYKMPMTLSQIRGHIVDRAASTQQDWLYQNASFIGAIFAALVPQFYRLWQVIGPMTATTSPSSSSKNGQSETIASCSSSSSSSSSSSMHQTVGIWWHLVKTAIVQSAEGMTACKATVLLARLISMATVFSIAWPVFRQLSLTEYTYKCRYKYAKFFAAITSVTKARRYDVPHFSLKNVLNIKMWLALRAGRTWLRRYERQRIADTVVSSTFRTVIILLAVLCFEVFVSKDKRPFLTHLLHWELLVWGGTSSFFLLRFFSLGSRINEKYHDTSVLLTEQINVQLRIFENCCRSNDKNKREKLVISSNVLKIANKLLKELDSPNRVSGFSMNPVLYNVTRVILLSAISAVASDVMGFKLKLFQLLKIK